MKNCKGVQKCFYLYKEYTELWTGYKIIALWTDNAKEYISLKKELDGIGITVEFTVYYTSELNSITEWLNQTLITITKSLLFDAWLLLKF